MVKQNLKFNLKIIKKEGVAKLYSENGILTSEIPFKNDVVIGVAKLYNAQTGKLEYEENLVNGKRNGLSKKYYPSGKVLNEINFKDDKEEGIMRVYYETGKLQGEIPYKNGQVDGVVKAYDENGKLIEQAVYKNGEEVK